MLAPCPRHLGPLMTYTHYSVRILSISILWALKNRDPLMTVGEKGNYWKNPYVLEHNLELECYQEVRWLKNSAIPSFSWIIRSPENLLLSADGLRSPLPKLTLSASSQLLLPHSCTYWQTIMESSAPTVVSLNLPRISLSRVCLLPHLFIPGVFLL